MNTYNISLSTTTTSLTSNYDTIDLFDQTEVSIDISNIFSEVFPYYVVFDWGDGSEVLEPEIKTFINYRTESILNEITKGVSPPFLNTTYKHIYYPSPNSLVKSLTLKIGIQYTTGEITQFNIPLYIRTEGYYENIRDVKLEGVKIINNVNLDTTLQLRTEIDNYIIETTNNTNADSFTSFVVNDVGENLQKIERNNENVVVDNKDGTEVIIVE
jgi:hypothetical protein|tara:strand:+ start:7348 stop:7989 length:642 start_codon:yes stop_codon:yes gene_type:complete